MTPTASIWIRQLIYERLLRSWLILAQVGDCTAPEESNESVEKALIKIVYQKFESAALLDKLSD